jgi:hypothetical protein
LDKNLTKLLHIYELKRKIVAYVKDEGYNLNIMTTTLKSIINCDVLGLEESFQRSFGHAFSKTCSYVTIDENFCKGLRYVSINVTQGDL